MWFLLACAEPPPPVAPEVHSWQAEAQLVVDGLEEVERLWGSGQRSAARILAERVYTDRWEPRLEPAQRAVEGVVAAREVEYAWGQLLAELERTGGKDHVAERLGTLQDVARKVGEASARRWAPPAGVEAPPPLPEVEGGSKPIVPGVRPAWEAG